MPSELIYYSGRKAPSLKMLLLLLLLFLFFCRRRVELLIGSRPHDNGGDSIVGLSRCLLVLITCGQTTWADEVSLSYYARVLVLSDGNSEGENVDDSSVLCLPNLALWTVCSNNLQFNHL